MNDWTHKALLFSRTLGHFFEYNKPEDVLLQSLQLLSKHTDCQQLLLIKVEDALTEKIIAALPEATHEPLLDTSKVEKTHIESFWLSKTIHTTRHLSPLAGYKQVIGIPIALDAYQGSILLLWKDPFEPDEELILFLEACANKMREVLELVFSYISLDRLSTRFNTILSTIPQAIIFIDELSAEVLLNAKAKHLLKIESDEKSFPPTMIADRMKKLRESVVNLEEVNQQAQQMFYHPEQTIHDWLWVFEDKAFNVSSVPTLSERLQGRLWVFEDISNYYFNNIKLSNLNLKLSTAKLEIENNFRKLKTLNEDKNSVIGIVSHDLRSPLNKIMSLLDLLEYDTSNLNGEQLEYLKYIKLVTTQGLELINDILDINAIENQAVQLNLSRFDYTELLTSQVHNFTSIASKKNILLKFDVPGSFQIISDKVKLSRIIENLFSNAVKFSPHRATVYINIKKEKSSIVLIVRDEGKGIPERDMPFLFQKYKKLSTKPTAGESSSGLGLSIVKVLVDSLSGHIHCTSVVGQGTTFTVSIPSNP